MKFLINGEIKLEEWRKFSKKVDTTTANAAKERVYAFFGSHNKVKRSMIKISSVNEVK
ncbi:50S ribosomal protein L18a [Candidatus Micrarchaeota archaeon]|nr:50S ribosomal protein L18a [Candidatus Micrarchaeota archaeon]